jgi:hypothetical protein
MPRPTVSPDFARADYQPLKFILGQRTRQLAAQPPAIAPAGHHVLDPYESQLRPVAFRSVHFQQQQCTWPEFSPCDQADSIGGDVGTPRWKAWRKADKGRPASARPPNRVPRPRATIK